MKGKSGIKRQTDWRILSVLGCLVLGGAAYLFLPASTELAQSHGNAPNLNEAKALNLALFQSPHQSRLPDETLPVSLRDLQEERTANFTPSNQLVIDSGLKSLFDRYLSALDERDLETVIKLIQHEIFQAYIEPARSEALDLLKRYIDYKLALVELENSQPINTSDLEQVQYQQRAVEEMRRQHFTPIEYDAFFADEVAENTYLLQVMRIQQDDALGEDEKQIRLQTAYEQLPAEIRRSRERVQRHITVRDALRTQYQNGADAADLEQFVSEHVPEESRQAMRELLAKKQEWNMRLDSVQSMQSQLNEAGLTEDAKRQELERYIGENFSNLESKRVIAMLDDGYFD